VLKPPASSHSPFRPNDDCASINGAATTLEAITALLRKRVTLNPQICQTPTPVISVNQTAATPILAFLIALECLTFKKLQQEL
jgi:hypothetical protein